MIVTADMDLTESGTVLLADGVAESARVLVYADDTNEPVQVALDAISRCRAIAEGHAFNIQIKPAVVGMGLESIYAYRVSPDGTEIVHRDGKPYRQEARRG